MLYGGTMRVLVTGGSGFVGRAVVAELRAHGFGIRVLARGTRGVVDGVETVRGSVADGTGLEEACRGCDAVIHLVGIIAEVGTQTYRRVHVDGTRNLLAAARVAGIRRWVQMSALGTRAGAVAEYHRTKWEAEELVRGSGLEWTIHRPSIVFGPGDGFAGFFERMSRWSPVLPLIGGGGMQFQPIAVEDVATCFVRALGRTSAVGKTYDLCGRERFTLRAILERVLEVTGRRRLLLPVPWAIAGIQAWMAEWVFAGILGKTPPLNRDQLRMLREDNIGDPGPMIRDYGLEPSGFGLGLRRALGLEAATEGDDVGGGLHPRR
jgi:NADH dehydrogenase